MNSLFEAVQSTKVFPDGKTFVDCIPKYPEEKILAEYELKKKQAGFNLHSFVIENYDLPIPHSTNYSSDTNRSVQENIEALWPVLTRKPDKAGGSLIALPHPYIVPGGRFGEVYYWDSYFTMLGLHVSGMYGMIENMVNNFSFLINQYGYIPNGNRNYFIGRSQPPFYSLMVKLLADKKGKQVFTHYLPQLLKEYGFWMQGAEELTENKHAVNHLVQLNGGDVLNRYWDANDTARPESYREDIELSEHAEQDKKTLFRHLRAGAESGWDYSYRWFKDPFSFASIHTTEIIPVDLNCLLYHLEKTIAIACEANGDKTKADDFNTLAEKRKKAILHYCWNEQEGFFVDYDFVSGKQKNILSLAGVSPLFFNLATKEQADKVAVVLQDKFLQAGGLISTLKKTGQQWDAPNGWAPLQWISIKGLENYQHHGLATIIARRWIKLNTDVFKRTGKLMEKYNVIETHLEAGGGEYAGQDGFGWTNGVLLALIEQYGNSNAYINTI